MALILPDRLCSEAFFIYHPWIADLGERVIAYRAQQCCLRLRVTPSPIAFIHFLKTHLPGL
ncbi:hypothetical protein BCL69_100428 [Nitrosomonas communis]|uniref:Uncharacterized protein n=1 Tax=Nitrosomonas communis TaxID=44574 RepID=A0A5D3YLZ7_9PROT|nr:hypothetical protein BCL69_100428 [Nitrosomonas communis]